MKSADIVAGEQYYVDPSSHWKARPNTECRYLVIDTAPHVTTHYPPEGDGFVQTPLGPAQRRRYRPASPSEGWRDHGVSRAAAGVLAVVLTEDGTALRYGDKTTVQVVNPRHVRGLYAAVVAEVAAEVEASNEEARKRRALRDERDARMTAAVDRAAALVPMRKHYDYTLTSGVTSVGLSIHTFEALLALAEKEA